MRFNEKTKQGYENDFLRRLFDLPGINYTHVQ